ncbi:hypothetical protein TRFO_09103 [Tritrichomonas foetus]|uniref:HECT domain-containing protein n=1 Tax=Tritrichomonas foetus TaxID=1144522 RepID=A0A1J4JFS7_9EUKA|nr:hypothetical protein TRFO_09103 [Tritrichomonas foetus]|eukprot:OHS97968.1 hypothetical protein TRFO_09103 [Tritrichomonas foetus]
MNGLTFVYPGTSIELKENGSEIEIDQTNIEEYKKLVKQFTMNIEAINAFKRGFSCIVQPGLENMLRAEEFCRLISGDDTVTLTGKDVRKNVIISHGYNLNAPQIDYFCEIIDEMTSKQKSMLFKFITGCERPPVGGLASLNPHLTIAKKVPETRSLNADDILPSVMTCTNYFKLPAYSSKEIMKEKILLAIEEGQGAFLLT